MTARNRRTDPPHADRPTRRRRRLAGVARALPWGVAILAVAPALPCPAASGTQPPAQERFARWMNGPASVLLLPDELDLLPQISGSGMQEEFVHWFWQRRDPDPTTSINEFRREFEQRLAFADKEFAEQDRPGWVTPRGQLYLLLGPPRRRGVTPPTYVVEGHLASLLVWEYEQPCARGRPVLFFFVETRQGVRLASLERGRRLSSEQVECLREARAGLVADPSPFARVVDRRRQSLPGHARFVRTGGGVLVVASLPLRELLGEPADGAIRYRVAIAARTGGGLDVQEERYLGALTFDLPPAMFRRWADSDLEIAVWMPAEAESYRITELPTGRTLTIAAGEEIAAAALAAEDGGAAVAIGHHLATTALMGDRGVAVAYLPADGANAPAITYVVQASAATSTPLPGGALALLPVPPARRR